MVEIIKLYAMEKYMKHIPCSFAHKKLFVLMKKLANQLFFTEEKMQLINLFKQFLKSMIIVKNQ